MKIPRVIVNLMYDLIDRDRLARMSPEQRAEVKKMQAYLDRPRTPEEQTRIDELRLRLDELGNAYAARIRKPEGDL